MFFRSQAFRTARLASAGIALALFAAVTPGAAGAAPSAQAPTPEPIGDGPTPCDAKGTHEVSPRIVEEGSSIDVEVGYDFDCSDKTTKKLDMMFVVEDTGALRIEKGGSEPANNLRDGLTRFAAALDPNNGSRYGLTRYAADPLTIVPINSNPENHDKLLQQIKNIRGNLGGVSGAAEAIRAASGQLNALGRPDPEAPSVMIIVDAGAITIGDPALAVERWITSCRAAKAEGVTVVVVALNASGGRMRDCPSRGWYFRSSSDEGADLPAIFEQLRDRLLRSKQVDTSEYNDFIQSAYYAYQDFSGVPREPDIVIFGSDLTWSEDVSARQKGIFNYRYKIDTRFGSGGFRSPITIDPGPQISLIYKDGAIDRILLPNQEICIYRPGNLERDCGDFIVSLTATAVATMATPTFTPAPPTDTPVASETPSPTEDPGTPVASPTATDAPETPVPTPDVHAGTVFIPFVISNHDLGDR